RTLGAAQWSASLSIIPGCLKSHPFSAREIEADAVVFINKETSLSARIDLQRERRIHLFACVLLDWPKRNDRAGADVQWHRCQIDCALDLATAFDLFFSPKVVPDAARQVDLPRGCTFFGHRRDQNSATPKVLICSSDGSCIVRIMQPERAHDGQSGLATFADR